jgi:hypothetical protein
MSRIIVHIAAVPTATEQRCLRCCCVLITLQDPKIVGACTIASAGFQPGGFVGVEGDDHSFAMYRDAMEIDERKCKEIE